MTKKKVAELAAQTPPEAPPWPAEAFLPDEDTSGPATGLRTMDPRLDALLRTDLGAMITQAELRAMISYMKWFEELQDRFGVRRYRRPGVAAWGYVLEVVRELQRAKHRPDAAPDEMDMEIRLAIVQSGYTDELPRFDKTHNMGPRGVTP